MNLSSSPAVHLDACLRYAPELAKTTIRVVSCRISIQPHTPSSSNCLVPIAVGTIMCRSFHFLHFTQPASISWLRDAVIYLPPPHPHATLCRPGSVVIVTPVAHLSHHQWVSDSSRSGLFHPLSISYTTNSLFFITPSFSTLPNPSLQYHHCGNTHFLHLCPHPTQWCRGSRQDSDTSRKIYLLTQTTFKHHSNRCLFADNPPGATCGPANKINSGIKHTFRLTNSISSHPDK